VAQCERTAPGADAFVVVLQPQHTQRGEPLSGKGFDELNYVHLFVLQAWPVQNLLRGRGQAVPGFAVHAGLKILLARPSSFS